MASNLPRIKPVGDSAVLVEPADAGVGPMTGLADAIRRALAAHRDVDVIPAYTSILVRFDPMGLAAAEVKERIRRLQVELSPASPRRFVLPVLYGGECGPDLKEVAALHGLTSHEVARRHAAALYIIRCIGFSPGYPYLDGLDPSLHTPRLDTPRTQVPAGSIAIGGGQTGIYPVATPGGWRIIGRTPVRLFDPSLEPPVPYRPADSIRFEAISVEEFKRLAESPHALTPETVE